jgi:hypothetical protein
MGGTESPQFISRRERGESKLSPHPPCGHPRQRGRAYGRQGQKYCPTFYLWQTGGGGGTEGDGGGRYFVAEGSNSIMSSFGGGGRQVGGG